MPGSPVALALAAALLAPLAAGASPLQILADLRFVYAFEDSFGEEHCPPVELTPEPPPGDFDASIGCVSGASDQTSTITPTEISGAGELGTTGGGESIDLESRVEVWFYVEEPTPFQLDGSIGFRALENPHTPTPETYVEARLYQTALPSNSVGPELTLVPEQTSAGPGIVLEDGPVVEFSESGVLLPHTAYTLVVGLRSDHQITFAAGGPSYGGPYYDFVFVLPEPAAGTLLVAGMTGLLALRRATRG